ncbi:Major Facilitator Superfamily protein [Trichomonas vaginalis G3]|uniref:Major Facilitator Superfamily protein n=1 Tax=Trichomonas vaginalis (strain ATCC PRA-98 / G3) TaxID=412133 RepID=A2ET44_TRIV3|nr:major facilitator superfamily transporter [Trichomonas vaginalis G3]EAY04160.1 Major Facilitator Superfamily protein [Trichomonas vaginalis G3]KAI5514878.1 Major Facilitator Superfamily protein family [Trichomonas vaginalis G3]|eukprot:XP_001316383.1 major facilitator superfamily transporter [Trichomonas vaginalis G3]
MAPVATNTSNIDTKRVEDVEMDAVEKTEDSKVWIPLAKRDRLSLWRIFGICASMFGFQTVFTVVFGLLSPIMDSEDINIPQVYRSLIYLIGPLAGFICQPLVGYYSDALHAKIGRRRPFIITGAVGSIVGFLFLYFCREIGKGISSSNPRPWSITFLIIALVLDFVSVNLLQAPARTIIADIIPKSQQVLGNSIAAVLLGLAQVFSNFIGGFNVAKHTSLNYQQLVIICGIVFIIVSVTITVLTAHEEQFTDKIDRPNPFIAIFRQFKSMPKPVWRIAIVYLFSWMGYTEFNNECSSYVGTDIYKLQGLDYDEGVRFGLIIIGVSSILVMIWSFVQDMVIKCIGLKLSYALSQIIEAVCLIPIFFIHNKWAALGLLTPLGIACSVFNSVPYAIVGMCSKDEEMGTLMGILNIFVVVGQQLANWIIGSGIGAATNGKKGPLLGSGCVFAFIAAILCFWIIVPEQKPESLDFDDDRED